MNNHNNQLKDYKTDARPNIIQSAEKSVFIENQNGGIVNLNYRTPQIDITGEMLQRINLFSRDYYQLIVTDFNILTDNSAVISTDSALVEGFVPKELLLTHSTLTEAAIARMLNIPAIICNENTDYYGKTDKSQMALYAYLKEIIKHEKEVVIRFQPITLFAQQLINDYSKDFAININCAKTDLNKSRWYIKKTDLFEAFRKADIKTTMPAYCR